MLELKLLRCQLESSWSLLPSGYSKSLTVWWRIFQATLRFPLFVRCTFETWKATLLFKHIPPSPTMSRRDITYILQKLSLDHRTSLAEKACAFLQATESNRTIKSHSSHAAICVDIAAKVYANTRTETNKNSKECLSWNRNNSLRICLID